jgi:hypothetical protein
MPGEMLKIIDFEIAISQIGHMGRITGDRQTNHILAQLLGQPKMIGHRIRQTGALKHFTAKPEFCPWYGELGVLAQGGLDSRYCRLWFCLHGSDPSSLF